MYAAKFEFQVRDHGYIKDSVVFPHYPDKQEIHDRMQDVLIDIMYRRGMCSLLFDYIRSVTNARPHKDGRWWWYKLVYSINALTTTPSSFLGGTPLTLQDKVFLFDQVQVILNAIKSARINLKNFLAKGDEGDDDKTLEKMSLCATMPDTRNFYRICKSLAASHSKRNRNRYDEAHSESLGGSSSEDDSEDDSPSEDDSSSEEEGEEDGEELGETSSEEDNSDDDSDDDSVVSNDDPNSVTNADAPSEIGNTEDEADEADEEPAESPAKKPRLMRENVQDEEDEFEDEEEA